MEIEINKLRFQLNKEDHTSSVSKSPKASGKVFIPQFIEYEHEKYNIISLGQNAFEFNTIESIEFPEESEILSFEKDCFYFANIQKIQIPAKLKNLNDKWNSNINDLTEIKVSPKNKEFTYFKGQFLVGKISKDSCTYDILHYARYDIEEAIIPPQIQILKKNSFIDHHKLRSIIFPNNSEAKCIERAVFTGTPIERLKIPDTLKEIDFSNFENLSNLNDIEISKKNKFFLFVEGKYLVKKKKKSNRRFSQLIFCRRDAEEITIPSEIREITRFSFNKCVRLRSLNFEVNSSLEIIDNDAFIYSSGLTEIVLPASVKKVGYQSFYGIGTLETVKFLGRFVEIQFWCFGNCPKLQSVMFPNAIGLNFSNSRSFDFIPEDSKIYVPKKARLIGPGFEKCQEHLVFIEKPRKSLIKELKKELKIQKENQEEEEEYNEVNENNHIEEEEEEESKRDKDIQLLLSHIRYLESRLSQYEKVDPFEFDDEDDFANEYQNETNNRNVFINTEVEEEFHDVIEKVGESDRYAAYKVIDNRDKRIICKKVLKIDEHRGIFNKFENFIYLNHPCICQAYGFNMDEKVNINSDNKIATLKESNENIEEIKYLNETRPVSTSALFMEFLPYKLKNAIIKGILNNTLKTRIAVEIAFGLSFIHQQEMNYQNLTVESVMLNYAFEAKITDFNCSEIGYNSKNDIYAYGILLFVIFTGQKPIIENGRLTSLDFNSSISKYCIGLIEKCIESDMSRRPEIDEIIDDMKKHSFALASEVDRNIVYQQYKKLEAIRKQNKQLKMYLKRSKLKNTQFIY
ncbi:hypothetical protein M9Y10_035096 [Tritrichomonas musculus]|uniref:Protein kinase domain-containing protein n=1 Tax=Tritrichomonas musculus TaxID=1915356 RepID=A0ABR2KH86_9EUKA